MDGEIKLPIILPGKINGGDLADIIEEVVKSLDNYNLKVIIEESDGKEIYRRILVESRHLGLGKLKAIFEIPMEFTLYNGEDYKYLLPHGPSNFNKYEPLFQALISQLEER